MTGPRITSTAAVLGLACLVVLGGCAGGAGTSSDATSIRFPNAYFYDADGKFLEEKGKDAYVAVMKYHGYPVFPGIREKLWVSDYGTGQFTKLGLGAVMFDNNEKDRYMLMDIYLLPNQMLPEHWHLKTEKNPSKLEGWLVRNGSSYIGGVGEANMTITVPKCHMGGKVTVKHEVLTKPGEFVRLAEVGTRHWQFAGPEGAIITEVATVHDNAGVRHSDKAMNDHFLGKK